MFAGLLTVVICTSFIAATKVTGGRTTRGGQGHLVLREHIAPQSEVIRAIFLEDSPCCGGPHRCCSTRARRSTAHTAAADTPAAAPPSRRCPGGTAPSTRGRTLESARSEVIQGHLMPGERIASSSEVIGAIMSGCSPCCGGRSPSRSRPHRRASAQSRRQSARPRSAP